MEKKDLDWSNLGFGYVKTDKRYVSNALVYSSMHRPYLKD